MKCGRLHGGYVDSHNCGSRIQGSLNIRSDFSILASDGFKLKGIEGGFTYFNYSNACWKWNKEHHINPCVGENFSIKGYDCEFIHGGFCNVLFVLDCVPLKQYDII